MSIKSPLSVQEAIETAGGWQSTLAERTLASEVRQLWAQLDALLHPTLDAPVPSERGWYPVYAKDRVPYQIVFVWKYPGDEEWVASVAGSLANPHLHDIVSVDRIGGQWGRRIPEPKGV